MNKNDYILGYKTNERLSYGTLYHLYYILRMKDYPHLYYILNILCY